MGAANFTTTQPAASAREAFGIAISRARYEHGHGGYTGTIAEKHDFILLSLKDEARRLAPKLGPSPSPQQVANHLTVKGDPRIDDKWGPAGCFDLGPDPKAKDPKQRVFLFFGWASE